MLWGARVCFVLPCRAMFTITCSMSILLLIYALKTIWEQCKQAKAIAFERACHALRALSGWNNYDTARHMVCVLFPGETAMQYCKHH